MYFIVNGKSGPSPGQGQRWGLRWQAQGGLQGTSGRKGRRRLGWVGRGLALPNPSASCEAGSADLTPHPVFPKTQESMGRNIHCLCLVLALALRFLSSFKYILYLVHPKAPRPTGWQSLSEHGWHACLTHSTAATGFELIPLFSRLIPVSTLHFWWMPEGRFRSTHWKRIGQRGHCTLRATGCLWRKVQSPRFLCWCYMPGLRREPRHDRPFHRGMWKVTLREGDFKAASEECCHRGGCRKDAKFTCWLMVRNTC